MEKVKSNSNTLDHIDFNTICSLTPFIYAHSELILHEEPEKRCNFPQNIRYADDTVPFSINLKALIQKDLHTSTIAYF